MGDGSSTASTVTRRVKITRIGCRAYVRFAVLHGLDGPAMIDEFSEVHNHRLTSVCNRDLDKISRSLDMFQKTLILDNSKLNIGAGLTFRQVKELVNGYENIGATLIDFKNFQRDIKCYIGLGDADLFIDRLEKLKATQPQFYFAYDVDPQNRLTKFFWADATCIRNYSFFGDAISFDPTYGTNKYDMVFTPFTGVNHHRKSVLFAGCLLLHEDDISFQWTFQRFLDRHGTKRAAVHDHGSMPWHKEGSKSAMDQRNSAIHEGAMIITNDHSFPELKTELPIEKHGAIIYTHVVFKVFQEEVMAADSCGVDDFEKEEHVRIIHVIDAETDKIFKVRLDLRSTDAVCECKLFERIGLLVQAYFVWVYKGKGIGRIPIKLDSNGNVIEDSYMATSDNSHLCNVWSEFRQIVGVLKTLPVEHTEDSSSEVTIHPPEQARNKGRGKRLKSANNKAIEKAAKPKRLCAYCKERVTHDRRTCPLRIADVAAEKAAKKKKV
ncbi:protein FAR-RED IMPAIRED RESPONSE 1-like [Silene latifolia]|uniref:protein FAR-RED IMPAIRED RESPONSE 1-like n=1 Tax=Silene latifolia TaxID=37657 RepID=UPI003D778DFC